MSSRPSTGGAAAAAAFLNDASQTGASDLVARALQRLSAFAAHERRAAHESKVMDKLMQASKIASK